MAELTEKQVLDSLVEIVAEYGEDHTYTKDNNRESGDCTYSTVDGEADCIVGHVLSRLQPEAFARIVEYEEEGKSSFTIAADSKRILLGIELSPDAVHVLYRAQTAQDAGHNWGEALDSARIEFQSQH